MAYVFGRINGDAQTHLCPQHAADSADPFISEKEIINYLSFIYKDPLKVQNTCLNYKSLNIKTIKTFSAF